MKIGLLLPYAEGTITSAPFLREFLAVAEDSGVDSVWAVEHVVVAESYEARYPYSPDGRMPSAAGTVPMPDPLELLAFAAGLTDRLLLGTAVVVAPLHSPVVLAKRAATIDRLSDGRLRLGLGIGWQVEEYAAVGSPFERRGARLEDGVAAMRALWSDAPATHHGPAASFDRVHLEPKPLGGSVPIVLGGNSAPAIERAGRIAEGWFPYTIGPDELRTGVEALHAAAASVGRAPQAVEVTVWPGSFDPARGSDPALAAAFAAAGADRLVLRPDLAGDRPFETLRRQVSAYLEATASLTG